MYLSFLYFSWVIAHTPACFAAAVENLDQSPARLISYAESTQWTKLLHVKNQRVAKRLRQDAPFFITEGGFKSSFLEMQATVQAFAHPEGYLKKGRGHPHCLFPARLQVLKRDLNLEFPEVLCPALEEWKAQVRSDRIVVVFASQFASHPGSVMGHTFIKFQNSQHKDYLNRTIGYAAEIPEDVSALAYVYRGLFGGFRGSFSEQPYYEKVQEYNNMESRDLWEYSLRLSEEEKDIFLNHLWELKENGEFDYYYLDENCAFIILAALEAATPNKNFLNRLPWYVLPLETIKALAKEDLIEKIVWKPSLQTQMTTKLKTLSSDQQKKTVRAIHRRSILELDDSVSLEIILDDIERSKVKSKGVLSEDLVQFQKEALLKRAQLGVKAPIKPSEPQSILNGHGPLHVEFSVGRKPEGHFFGFRFRPFLHNFMDNDVGYLRNSAMSFMELEWRGSKSSDIDLFEVIFFDVQLSRPYTALDPDWSWKMKAAYQDRIYFLESARGITWDLTDHFSAVVMGYGKLETHQEFEDDYRFWPGILFQGIFSYKHKVKWLHTEILAKELRDSRVILLKRSSEVRVHNILPHLDAGLEFSQFDGLGSEDKGSIGILKLIYDF